MTVVLSPIDDLMNYGPSNKFFKGEYERPHGLLYTVPEIYHSLIVVLAEELIQSC